MAADFSPLQSVAQPCKSGLKAAKAKSSGANEAMRRLSPGGGVGASGLRLEIGQRGQQFLVQTATLDRPAIGGARLPGLAALALFELGRGKPLGLVQEGSCHVFSS